jgi:hypothetical protein
MAKDRIYFVGVGEDEHLVRATRQSVALMHTATVKYSVRLATQNDLERLLAKGTKVEIAGITPEHDDDSQGALEVTGGTQAKVPPLPDLPNS